MGGALSSAAARRVGGTLPPGSPARLAGRGLVLPARPPRNPNALLPRPPPPHAARACPDAFGGRWNACDVHGHHAARGGPRNPARASPPSPRAGARPLRRLELALPRSLSPQPAQQSLRSTPSRLVRAEPSR